MIFLNKFLKIDKKQIRKQVKLKYLFEIRIELQIKMATQVLFEVFRAIRDNDLNVFKNLIEDNNIDIDDNSLYEEYFGTFLSVAVRTNNKDMVNTIINMGANIDKTNYYGETPLHEAIEMKVSADIVKSLVLANANIYAFPDGFTISDSPFRKVSRMMRTDYYDTMVVKSKGRKMWKKLKFMVRLYCAMNRMHKESVEHVWAPGGKGYDIAKEHFYNMIVVS